MFAFDLAQFKAIGRDDVFLLVLAHAVEKQPGLREVIAERVAALTNLVGIDAFRVAFKPPVLGGGWCFFRPAAINGIRLVGRTALMDGAAMLGITLVIVKRCNRPVDRDFVEVRPTQTADLRVGIREKTTLQQRIIGEVDTRHDMPWAKRDLLGLREEVIGVAIKHHLAQRSDRYQFFGDQLGRIKNVEVEFMLVFLRDDLNAEFPFRIVACFNRFPQISAVVIGIFACQFLCFVPHQ